jgi:N-formylglutamate amidohydrolase
MLLEEVNACVQDCGACVVVDCHSFPSRALPYEDDQNPDRPDLCIGTDRFHTPGSLEKCVVEAAKAEGFSVEPNRPFAGALVPLPLYRQSDNVFAVMLELNRGLYMDEATGEKSAAFDGVQKKLERILGAIGAWRNGGPALGSGLLDTEPRKPTSR